MTIFHTVTRERTVATGPLGIATIDSEEEIELTIEGNYIREYAGRHDQYGAPETPPEPAEFEITSVTPDVELEESEIEAITEKAIEQARDEREDYSEE